VADEPLPGVDLAILDMDAQQAKDHRFSCRPGRNLSSFKSIATEMDTVGFLAGLYMLASPPQGDTGLWATGDRLAGVGAMAGSGVGIAKNAANVDFSKGVTIDPADFGIDADPLVIESLQFIPDVGLVVSVVAGVYMTVDWIVHNPQEVHFILDHPQVAECNLLGNMFGKQIWEQAGCAPAQPSI
jgi:hypothetical protein